MSTHPLYTFGPISCKVYLSEHTPWSKLPMEFEKHSLKHYANLRYTSRKVTTKDLCIDKRS